MTLEIGEPILDARWNANIKKTIKNAPKPDAKFQASTHMENGQVLLEIKSTNLKVGKTKNPYFYPYIQDMLDADDPQSFQQFEHGIQMTLKPSWKLDDGLPAGYDRCACF